MSKIDEINHCIARSVYHREQIEAVAQKFLDLHVESGLIVGEAEAELLADVLYAGLPYPEAIERIRKLKKYKS